MPQNQGGFQTFVNLDLPPGAPGDWAGANIRANVPVGPWELVAPPSGTTVGVIAWADPTNGIASSYFRPNAFPGFVHKEQQALIYAFLGLATMQIPVGTMVTAQAQGDWWGVFTGGCTVGQKVYANPTTGALSGNATGNSVGGAITAATLSSAGLLTVATITGTPLAVGQIIGGSGVPFGSYIQSLGTGTGGAGTYNLANLDGTAFTALTSQAFTYTGAQETQFFCAQTIAALASVTATLAASPGAGPFGVLTVSAVGSGVIQVGQFIQSSGTVPVPITANIQIVEQLTGTTGGVGTYLVSNTIAVGTGQTFTTYNGQAGKISSWLSGY